MAVEHTENGTDNLPVIIKNEVSYCLSIRETCSQQIKFTTVAP